MNDSWFVTLAGWPQLDGSPLQVVLSAVLFAAVAAAVAWLVAGVVIGGDEDLAERAPLETTRIRAAVDAAVMGAFVGVFMPAPAAFAMLVGFWAVGARVDLATRRLPNSVTLPAAAAFALALVPFALSPGGPGLVPYFAAVVTYIVFYLLAIFSPASFGLGDVKLGLSVGLALGVFGGTVVFAGATLAFMVASLSGVLAAVLGGVSTKGLKVAFGPFLVAGALSGPILNVWLGEGAM